MSIPFFDISRRELRDASRLALQSAVAAAAMYSFMLAAGLPEKFVGILSAVLVVQPSVGTTLGQAWDRVAATLVGCLIGGACLYLLPDGYGTAAALALSMLAMNALAGFRPSWRYGVVAAVALALGSDGEVLTTAIERSMSIGIGVLIGIAVCLIVWPERSTTRASRFLRSALNAAADSLHHALASAGVDSDRATTVARSRYLNDIREAREAIDSVRIADNDKLKRELDAVERFHHAVVLLNRLGEKTDDITRDREAMLEPIRTIREASCEVARDLADGGRGDPSKLETMRGSLTELREMVAGHDDDATSHEFRNALVFALDEIEDSIQSLVDIVREDGPDG